MSKGYPGHLEAERRLSGGDLYDMFSTAALLMERNVEAINALNVFPVPDGDTGTNMYLTLRAVVEGANTSRQAPAAEVAATMARGALMGARGNSGVILSQFFKGLALGLEGASDFGSQELVSAFQHAKEHSYKAVGEPVEGTILTVISSVAEATQRALAQNGIVAVADICEAACEAASESVARTPTMLPVLREAGVVDAGGYGLAVMLEGVRRFVNGVSADAPSEVPPPEPVGIDGTAGAVSTDFLEATDEEMYGYCTQFLVQGHGLAPDAIRERMADMARSAVVVGDDTMVQVHVHTEDPGPVVSVGVSHGILSQVKIENMDAQHGEFSAARRGGAASPEKEKAEVAVVAVAWGVGLEVLFTSLGASGIVAGGDTMNPSVQDMMEAVQGAPSDNVVILPNNRNIVPAAVQAANNSSKTVRVVPTRSIPQGVAAMLSFNPERDLDSNVGDMEGALSSVQTGEVTEAVRAVTLGGVQVEPGRLIGLLEGKLVVAGEDLGEVFGSLLKKAEVSEGNLVTLYRGDPLASDDADKLMQETVATFPGVEVELVEGGQPLYHVIVSIE